MQILHVLAAQTVHASGINWVGISPVLGVIVAAAALILAMQSRREARQDKRSEEVKQEIASAIGQLSEVLLAKLETKETVARISERLARLEGAAGREQP